MKARPKLLPITEQMKEWSAHLDREISSWAGVVRKPMFGMISFYRDDTIFAAVPRTKSFEPENSIVFKLYNPAPKLKSQLGADDRITLSPKGVTGWTRLEIRNTSDLKAALSWIETAYANAKPSRSPAKKRHD